MNYIWISSYIADICFIWLYFRRATYAPDRQRKWLKPLLCVALLPLYLNDSFLAIPSAPLRVGLRVLIFFLWLFFAEGVPAKPSVYAAVFWTTAYTLFQNVFFGPYFSGLFSGNVDITESHLLSQILISVINALVRALYYAILTRILPFEGTGQVSIAHTAFVLGICALAMYVKDTGSKLRAALEAAPSQFTGYFMMLQTALLLALIVFEYSRRSTMEAASLSIQSTAANALLANIKDRQMSEEAVRTLRHDLKNHAVTLQLLLDEGRTEDAKAYLENFKAAASQGTDGYHTGNDLLNGLLKQKLAAAKANGVEISCSLDFSAASSMDNFDICVIMGNLLDNAVEACMEQPKDARRFIKISGGPAANCQLVRIENSDNKNDGTLTALPQTTKADKALHGFGLRSVNSVLKRYGGTMAITQENGSYTASLLIPVNA